MPLELCQHELFVCDGDTGGWYGSLVLCAGGRFSYHAAPTTDRPMQREMPKLAHPTGEMDSMNAPTYRKKVRQTVLLVVWSVGKSQS